MIKLVWQQLIRKYLKELTGGKTYFYSCCSQPLIAAILYETTYIPIPYA